MGNEMNGSDNNDNNNSRSMNIDNNKQQMKTYTYAPNKQIEATAQTQTIIDQVDDTIESVVIAAELSQDSSFKESTVNRTCDAAILALNMFALTCQDLYKQKDTNSIILGKKQAHDEFEKLRLKDPKTFNLIEPHRNFIIAALNGQKNLEYKTSRVKPAHKTLFQQDTQTINETYAKLIANTQRFDERQEQLLDPTKNKELTIKHQLDIKEFHNNDRYKNISSKSQSNINRPQQSDLYFTKSGKRAEFVDERSIARKKKEQQELDAALCRSQDVYDTLLPKLTFMNSVLKLSPQNNWGKHKEPICCKILVPNDKERVTRDKNMVKIELAKPYGAIGDVPLQMLELDVYEIKAMEKKHVKFNGKLGYKSIEEQETEIHKGMIMDD